MSVLQSKSMRILSLVLLAQAGIFYGFQRREAVPPRLPLENFSIDGTGWRNVQEMPIDQDSPRRATFACMCYIRVPFA